MKLQEYISVVINPDTSAKEMHDAIIKGCLRGQNKVISLPMYLSIYLYI